MMRFSALTTFLGIGFGVFPGAVSAQNPVADTTRGHNRIAVLDFVDVGDGQSRPEATEIFRHVLASSQKWTVFNRDSVAKRLVEFSLNPAQPCNNPQCAFDIGNILQAEFVLYGTVSPLGPVNAITVKLLNISTAKVVWTRVGEAMGSVEPERSAGLFKAFSGIADEMSLAKLHLDKNQAHRSLAIIDLSENAQPSRVFFERTATRIYGSPNYDLMSPSELTELLTALEISKYSIVPSLDNMIGLGRKLGVSGLIYSRLYRDGKNFVYRLAMYDVAEKALVVELPPQPSESLIKLLDYEKDFFNTLFDKETENPKKANAKGDGKSNKALWISLGLLGVGGGVAAYWVDNLWNSRSTGKQNDNALSMPMKPPSNKDE